MMAPAENDPRRIGTIWMLDLDQPTPRITPLVHASFRRVGLESAPALAAALGGEKTAEVCRRFETGRRCYTAWVEDKLVTYGWVSFEEEYVDELNLRLSLLPGEAYIWDCATLPAFRRKRLYSALLVHIVEALRAENLCRVWIGADLNNEASHRGIARAGFRSITDLLVARESSSRKFWAQGKPGVPNRLVAEACRVYLSGVG